MVVQIPHGKGHFGRKGRPIVKYRDYRPYAAAMRPFVKLLWQLVIVSDKIGAARRGARWGGCRRHLSPSNFSMLGFLCVFSNTASCGGNWKGQIGRGAISRKLHIVAVTTGCIRQKFVGNHRVKNVQSSCEASLAVGFVRRHASADLTRSLAT